FEELTLDLGEFYKGKKFTVKARNVSDENFYIQSATLNGESYNKAWITHEDIVQGGTLVFEMGPQPNKKWGSSPAEKPPSMSEK
ncbi:glycoside hydrolase domain-containing protein, partial [Maribellus maritimus]|uniref:glycoside hydrolase domain-containing protein n=1 Tax=Maribellus maritimus TaxID=2870838 RepID=UPI001EEAB4DE